MIDVLRERYGVSDEEIKERANDSGELVANAYLKIDGHYETLRRFLVILRYLKREHNVHGKSEAIRYCIDQAYKRIGENMEREIEIMDEFKNIEKQLKRDRDGGR